MLAALLGLAVIVGCQSTESVRRYRMADGVSVSLPASFIVIGDPANSASSASEYELSPNEAAFVRINERRLMEAEDFPGGRLLALRPRSATGDGTHVLILADGGDASNWSSFPLKEWEASLDPRQQKVIDGEIVEVRGADAVLVTLFDFDAGIREPGEGAWVTSLMFNAAGRAFTLTLTSDGAAPADEWILMRIAESMAVP